MSVVVTAEKKLELSNGAVISFNGDMNYTSPTEYDLSNHPIGRYEAVTLYNASVSFTSPSGRYTAGLWGRNLADLSYANSLIIGNTPQVVSGNPRTFGIRLNYRY